LLVARRICDLVAQDAEHPVLSVSVGVASYPQDAQTIGTLLYAADRALYEMKSRTLGSAQTGLRTVNNAYEIKGNAAND
jgi:GGDEF domain-containing protein